MANPYAWPIYLDRVSGIPRVQKGSRRQFGPLSAPGQGVPSLPDGYRDGTQYLRDHLKQPVGDFGDSAWQRLQEWNRTSLDSDGSGASGGASTPFGVTAPSDPASRSLSFNPIDSSWVQRLLGQNDKLYKSSSERWKRLLQDKRNYQKRLPVAELMAMGPQDWADPRAIADERADLQYDPQIAEALLERKKIALQGDQNRSDIKDWYGLIDKAMGAARTANTQSTKDISAFTNDASQSLMQSLGGAANSANGAIAATAQSNNNMLATLGQVQGNYLQNSQLNAQLEGAQQQTNQMRLNDQADQLAAQQLAKLRGSKAASAADYRFTMEGQNKDLQSQRLQTKAGLLSTNAATDSANITRRLGMEQAIDTAGKDWMTGSRALYGDQSAIEKWVEEARDRTARANIELDTADSTSRRSLAAKTTEIADGLLKTVVDSKGRGIGGISTPEAALEALKSTIDQLEAAGYTGLRQQIADQLRRLKSST